MTMRFLLIALVAGAASAGAQTAGPPLARKVERDTQPSLKKPKTVSAPPSTVAPRTKVVRPTAADSAPVAPMKRVSASPDSVRPAGPQAARIDSARAPRLQPPPPRPATRAVAPVATQASLISDTPPLGATARCKDGSFVTSPVDDATCRSNGGLAVRIPAAPAPPRRPNP